MVPADHSQDPLFQSQREVIQLLLVMEVQEEQAQIMVQQEEHHHLVHLLQLQGVLLAILVSMETVMEVQ